MPYQWLEPDLFLEFAGVAVYHCYDELDTLALYWYTTDPFDCDYKYTQSNAQFDVRDLPDLGLDVNDRNHHLTIIQQAITGGIISGQPAITPAPPGSVVKIEVLGGVAYVLDKPPGVKVEIIDRDGDDVSSEPPASVEAMPQNRPAASLSLRDMSKRIGYMVTDLNGFISLVVNDEITLADLHGKFNYLALKLDKLEKVVQEVGEVFWGASHHAQPGTRKNLITLPQALHDANWRLAEWGQEPADTLEEAVSRLKRLSGSECECDNTHQANNTTCCLCLYQAVLAQAKSMTDGKE